MSDSNEPADDTTPEDQAALGRFMEGIESFMAEVQREQHSLRIRKGLAAKKAKDQLKAQLEADQ